MPSYLFALASGDLASASIGPRSQVWTGPEELTAAQWEFEADTEKYIEIAEKIVYDYAWTTYNVLVLPPSFPYGGMENRESITNSTSIQSETCNLFLLTFVLHSCLHFRHTYSGLGRPPKR